MGLIRSSFSFMFGTLSGIYIAQNYNVPNIKKLAEFGLSMAKQMEETHRKPSNKKDRDDVSEWLIDPWQGSHLYYGPILSNSSLIHMKIYMNYLQNRGAYVSMYWPIVFCPPFPSLWVIVLLLCLGLVPWWKRSIGFHLIKQHVPLLYY